MWNASKLCIKQYIVRVASWIQFYNLWKGKGFGLMSLLLQFCTFINLKSVFICYPCAQKLTVDLSSMLWWLFVKGSLGVLKSSSHTFFSKKKRKEKKTRSNESRTATKRGLDTSLKPPTFLLNLNPTVSFKPWHL